MTVNLHIIKAIAEQRIVDLHREAVPRPAAKAKPKRTFRLKQATRRTRGIPAARAE